MYTQISYKMQPSRSPFSADVLALAATDRAAARELDRKYIRAIAGKVKASVDRDMDRVFRSLSRREP